MPSQVDKFKFPEPRNAWQFIQDAQDEAADVSGINCLNLWMPTWVTYFIMVHETRLDRRIAYTNYEDQRTESKNNIAIQKETNERLRLLRRRITEEYNFKENKHSFTLDVQA